MFRQSTCPMLLASVDFIAYTKWSTVVFSSTSYLHCIEFFILKLWIALVAFDIRLDLCLSQVVYMYNLKS